MAEDKAVSQEQVKQIAQRALVLEQYILRRAWGLCYAVVAVEIALIVLSDVIFAIAGLPSDYSIIARLILNTAISILALAAAAWVFKRAYDAMLIRREIVDSLWAKLLRPSRIAMIWLIYYLPIFFVIIFLRPVAAEVLFVLQATSVVPFYFILKVSFPQRIPREGIAVLVTFLFCALGNLTLFLLKTNFIPYLAVWGILVVVSAIASAYAYRQKPPNPPEDTA